MTPPRGDVHNDESTFYEKNESAMSSLKCPAFKRVPAVDKCFNVLHFLAACKKPLSISYISRKLGLSKSTVFNLIHTLADLRVLEQQPDGKFGFGAQLYVLGRAAGSQAELIMTVRPYLEEISRSSNFSAFFGIRSGLRAVIVDKIDAAVELRVSSDVGMRLPLHAGAHGVALLAQLPESDLDEILARMTFEKFTPKTHIDKNELRRAVLEVREKGVAVDIGGYIEGIVALAVPLNVNRPNIQAAIWVVGLTRHTLNGQIPEMCERLKAVAEQINMRFSVS